MVKKPTDIKMLCPTIGHVKLKRDPDIPYVTSLRFTLSLSFCICLRACLIQLCLSEVDLKELCRLGV